MRCKCGEEFDIGIAPYEHLCKKCRAKAIADEDMRARLRANGVAHEVRIIKNQNNKLSRRIQRLEELIINKGESYEI